MNRKIERNLYTESLHLQQMAISLWTVKRADDLSPLQISCIHLIGLN